MSALQLEPGQLGHEIELGWPDVAERTARQPGVPPARCATVVDLDPDKTVMLGLQTFEQMMFGFVDLADAEIVGSPNLQGAARSRSDDAASGPRLRAMGGARCLVEGVSAATSREQHQQGACVHVAGVLRCHAGA